MTGTESWYVYWPECFNCGSTCHRVRTKDGQLFSTWVCYVGLLWYCCWSESSLRKNSLSKLLTHSNTVVTIAQPSLPVKDSAFGPYSVLCAVYDCHNKQHYVHTCLNSLEWTVFFVRYFSLQRDKYVRILFFWDIMLYHWVSSFWHFKGTQFPYLVKMSFKTKGTLLLDNVKWIITFFNLLMFI